MENRKEMIERIAKKFVMLQETEKPFIIGYMVGKEEERAVHKQKEKLESHAE